MIRKHLTAALLFLVLTLLLTNPLIFHILNSVEDKQDGLLNTWIVAWVGHALVTDPLNVFNTNIFYPYTNTLAFSEILVPPGLVALPFTLAANNPIFGYNIALLAMFWLDGFAMYLLVFDLTRRAEAGWIAGAIYAFNPFNLGNLAQMQLVTLGFLPLTLLFLRKLVLEQYEVVGFRPSRFFAIEFIAETAAFMAHNDFQNRNASQNPYLYAFLFAFFFILQCLSSFYYALLAAFAVGLYLVVWLIARRTHLFDSLRRVLVPLAAALALIAIVLIPFLLPYFQVQRELGFQRRVKESEPFSASLKQFTQVAPQNVVYGSFLAPDPVTRVGGYALDNLFPGLIAVALAIVSVILARGRFAAFLIVLLLASFVLALGPRLYLTSQLATDVILPYRWLYEIFPPMRALRAPVRFDALINFALAALAGLGVAALLAWYRIRRVSLVGLGAVALIGLEYLALPAANTVPLAVANEIPDIYKWMAAQPEGVMLELPMMGPNESNELDISTQYYTTYHWQKTPDGYSGFVPPRRGEVAYEMQSFPSPRSIALLRALDVNYLIDHTRVSSCYVLLGPVGYIKPTPLASFENPCVYQVPPPSRELPKLAKQMYVPSVVQAGAPFYAFLVMANTDVNAHAVKPTDRATLQVQWDGSAASRVSFPTPLVTSSVTIVPIPLTAPAKEGAHELELNGADFVIGTTEVRSAVQVGNELARETVLPASVELQRQLPGQVGRGETLQVPLRWLPFNKINAYYSASVRLLNAAGDKVANTDRQPGVATFLWKPDEVVPDTFTLQVPPDIPPGAYRLELVMYQADTDESALLLDVEHTPRQSISLGEINVK